jgi:hypothetical protein
VFTKNTSTQIAAVTIIAYISVVSEHCFAFITATNMGSGISASIITSSCENNSKEIVSAHTTCAAEDISYVMSEKERRDAEEMQAAGDSWRQYCKATAAARRTSATV